MSETRISIVIPVYNNPLIERALNSVRKYVNKTASEVIVVDGRSTDTTGDIIEKNSDLIDLYISEKDAGPYDAANKGILMAKGMWIFWLAADDELLMNPEELLDRHGADGLDVICGSMLSERRNGEFITVRSEANLEKLNKHCTLCQPATLFRREKMIETGLYDLRYRFAADRELFLRLRENGAKFKIVDDIVVRFYYGGLTTSRKVFDSYKEDLVISKQYGHSVTTAYGYYGLRLSILLLKRFIIGITESHKQSEK